MKCFVLAALVAVALARPDVSHLSGGYNYNPPSSNYGAPYQTGESQQHHHHHHHQVPTGSYLPGVPSDSRVDYSSSRYPSGNPNAWYNPSLIQDQKHVYYFANPEDEEIQQHLRINIVPSHTKNVNTIFVKAPQQAAVIPEVNAPPSTIEDKTKVVVLVKKPEKHADINIPAAPVAKVGKPEVLVVKYKDQHDAERTVAGSDDYIQGSNVRQLGDKHTFVKTLESEESGHGISVHHGDNVHGGGVVSTLYEASSGPSFKSSGSLDGSYDGSSVDGSVSGFGLKVDDIRTGGIVPFGRVDSSEEGSHSGSSFVSDGSGHIGGANNGGLKITVETTGHGAGGALTGSGSSQSSRTLEDDSLFSKYGPPGESGPY